MESIDTHIEWPQHFSRPMQLAALQEFLGNEEIDAICRQLGHGWRDRALPPATTVRSLVYRGLHPDKSILATLADLATVEESLEVDPAPASWCEARDRLPEAVWSPLIEASVRRLSGLVADRYTYAGRPVGVIDGSTLSMPDAPALVEAFGYSRGRRGKSRFPIARITFLTLAGSEAVVAYEMGPYRTSEITQARKLWPDIPPGAICLTDKHFSSFYDLAKLRQRHIDMLCPLHQRRDPHKLIAKGNPLGEDDWLVEITLSAQSRKTYADPSLPPSLTLRLLYLSLPPECRSTHIWLVTTLLDPQQYSRQSLCDLFGKRWGVETRIGSLKSTLELRVLRSRTPHAVRHEVAATVLAHNLTWTLIHQAAHRHQVPAERISFAAAVKTILTFSGPLRMTQGPRRAAFYDKMLAHIAHQTHLYRPGRREPRRVKRDPVRYPFLLVPRQEARAKCLS